jgi:ABC-type branched-subunit amino acid transport system substrate-binding protein
MPYDTKTTDFDAINAINSAVNDGADIVIGPFSSQATDAIVDIANKNGLIVISLSDNQSLITPKRPNLYLMGFTPQQEIHRLISYLVDNKNFYGFSALFPSSVYGSSVSTMFTSTVKRKDVKVVKRDFYSTNDPKLQAKTSEILKAISYRDSVYKKYEEDKMLAKVEKINMDVEFKYKENDKIYADALLIPDSGSELTKIGNYSSKVTGRKPLLVGTSKWLNNNLYNDSNFTNSIFVAPDPTAYSNFQNDYHEHFQSYPLRVASLVYDSVISVSEAYAKAQGRENLKNALENYQGFYGVNGRFRFLKTGILERKFAIVKILDGKYEIVDYDENPFLRY